MRRDAPFFVVRVVPEGGKAVAIDLTDTVISFSFEDHTKKADKLSLTLDNHDLRHFDNTWWRKGNVLEVLWGYPGRVAPARGCVVRRARGGRVFTVEAYAKSVLMNGSKRRRVWDNVTRSEVVRRIAAEYGYGGEPAQRDEGLQSPFVLNPPNPGMLAEGNINLLKRPRVRNSDGSVSTVRSISFEDEGVEVLAPTVTDDGRIVSDREAVVLYWQTGRHLGKFSSPDSATAYAERLHEQQDTLYSGASASDYSGQGECHISDTEIRREHVTQAGMTDAQFLAHLARKEGYEFWVDHTGLNWRERDYAQAPRKVLTYFTDAEGQILDFNVDTSVTGLAGYVEARGISANKKVVTGKADNTTERKGLATVIEVVDPVTGVTSLSTRMATEETSHSTEDSAAAAKKAAEAKYRSSQGRSLKMSMTVVGDPELAAKSVVEVRGMGKRLSGKYYVLVAKHTLDRSGYRTELELRKDGTEGYGDGKDVKSGAVANSTKAPSSGSVVKALHAVEVVDTKSGETRIEWRP